MEDYSSNYNRWKYLLPFIQLAIIISLSVLPEKTEELFLLKTDKILSCFHWLFLKLLSNWDHKHGFYNKTRKNLPSSDFNLIIPQLSKSYWSEELSVWQRHKQNCFIHAFRKMQWIYWVYVAKLLVGCATGMPSATGYQYHPPHQIETVPCWSRRAWEGRSERDNVEWASQSLHSLFPCTTSGGGREFGSKFEFMKRGGMQGSLWRLIFISLYPTLTFDWN